jgi:hypothetical protein
MDPSNARPVTVIQDIAAPLAAGCLAVENVPYQILR